MPEYTPPSGGGTGTIDGTLTAGRIAYAQDSDTLTDDADFTYDATNDLLAVTKVKAQNIIEVENATGSAIAAGSAVYVSAIGTGKPQVALADADDAAKMPSVGIVTNQIANGASGYVAINGQLNGLDRTTAAGPVADADITTADIGKTLYVSTTAGKLTVTRPTGTSAQVQNVGRIIDVSGSNFKMQISNIGRANDVPNQFTVTGSIGAATLTATNMTIDTDVLHVDATNDRVGIGTTSPEADLSVVSASAGNIFVLECTDAGAISGPDITLIRDSSSPADDDFLGRIVFKGRDDGGNLLEYGNIKAQLGDATNGSEGFNMFIQGVIAGTNRPFLGLRGNDGLAGASQAEVCVNDQGIDMDFRVETDTDTAALFVQGSTNRVGISTTSPVASLDVDAGQTFRSTRLLTVSSVTGTLSEASHAGRYLICSGNVTLPATSSAGEHYTILNTTGGDITIGRNGNNINGAAADATVGTYNGATAIAIGSNNWIVLGV